MDTVETPTNSPDAIEERWRSAMFGLVRLTDEDVIAWVSSKRFLRIDRTLEELAGLLVEDGYGSEDVASLAEAKAAIWDAIKSELTGWASRSDERFAARHSDVA